jgi:hypothetical protein
MARLEEAERGLEHDRGILDVGAPRPPLRERLPAA